MIRVAYERHIYEEIMSEYEQIRVKAKDELEEKKRDLYEHVPKIEEIDISLKSMAVGMSLQILNNPDHAEETLENLKSQIFDLTDRKYFLLTKNGYPKDYLELKYICKTCHDTGYVSNKRCACLQQKLIEKSYDLSNLKGLIDTQNFAHFDLGYYSNERDSISGTSPAEQIKSIYAVCQNFIENFDETKHSLLLYGPPGIGKTFMSSCIAKEILDKGYTVIYESAYDLFTLYEDYKFMRIPPEEGKPQIARLYKTDLLIIDDLGTEITTRSTIAFLFNLLDTRLRHNLKTVISTNQSVSELGKTYSQRFSSRIFEYFTQLEFLGSDIRLQKMRESS